MPQFPYDRASSPPRLVIPGLVVVMMIAAALLVGCSSDDGAGTATTAPGGPSGAGPGFVDITPAQLAEMLKNKDFVFINTHVPYEGEIEQTDLFLDFERAAELVTELPEDKDAKIVVYCRSDRMSMIAAEVWASLGYTNIYNLDGGFVAWQDAGYELLDLGR